MDNAARTVVDFGRDVCGSAASSCAREWLVTNGIGGYASGTIGGALTRAYHGLLIAALDPPGGRTLLVAKLDETCEYLGRSHELATNRWGSGAVDPQGYRNIERFFLEGSTPVWHFAFADVLLEKRITMALGVNETFVRYRVLRARGAVAFSLRAIVDRRDHHGVTRASGSSLPSVVAAGGAVEVRYPGAAEVLYLQANRGGSLVVNEWYRSFALAREAERGLPDLEDHVHAATLQFSLDPGGSAYVRAGVVDAAPRDPEAPFAMRAAHDASLLAAWRDAEPSMYAASDASVAQLVLAADQFVVARPSASHPRAKTVIAGYPWFGDWGRDTAIALPGLTLVTGRPQVALAILETFARYVDGGMIPNVLPDRGETPLYNSVDAALWYIEAVRAYAEATGDDAALGRLYGACVAIVAGYRDGTRYGIQMDPSDGLVSAGEPGVQLTWMDAKVGDLVVTPRMGKPVEVNALWYNALRSVAFFAQRAGVDGSEYDALADRVRVGFERYVLPDGAGLADVLDGPSGDSLTLRPNQIFAASLPFSPLAPEVLRSVVDVCGRELLTSHGLRTLAVGEPAYVGRYGGPRESRDAAYHQGTVWPWLLGSFACAYARAYGDVAAARALLAPLVRSLGEFGLGTIAEIADGDAPFAWNGAIAQAWSVGETLRALNRLM
jgi:predicted glycogen debranching enzyme